MISIVSFKIISFRGFSKRTWTMIMEDRVYEVKIRLLNEKFKGVVSSD